MDYVLTLAHGGDQPPKPKVGNMVASCRSSGGTPHTFWVGANRHQVFVKWQNPDGTWKGGGLFAEAHENITGLAASVTDDNYLALFARCDDGSVVYTWQNPSTTVWHGQGKHTAAFAPFN